MRQLLKETAQEYNCDELCVCCYHRLLEDKLGYDVIYPYNETVSDVAKEHNNEVIIVRIKGHLTTCVFGVCVDTWDCTEEKVDCFWVKS